jgi:formate hydrogenlyase subunit 6/NADH:ubiquinone oxidoreductase subunit I
MKLPSLFQWRIVKLALTSLFSRPFTDPYPKGSFEPIKEFRGRPRYHEKDCIGCTACAQVCPSGAIEVIDKTDGATPSRTLVHHLDLCIQCGQCQRYCTTEKGILLTNEWEFLGFKSEDFEERIQKELVMCEVCGKAIAPIDQIRWLVDRLGPLAFCNPTLMLSSHKEMTVVDPGLEKDSEYPSRARRINIQCPHCRRKTALSA